jgi:Pyridoxamine 5'-phosphate oxidase
MSLHDYFTKHTGTGVLATANANGVIGTAIYAKPHILGEDTLAFIMRERLAYANLQENPHANYLFIEQGGGFNGVRLFLEKVDEVDDRELIDAMSRRHLSKAEDEARGAKHLVRFRVRRVLPLVGDGEAKG